LRPSRHLALSIVAGSLVWAGTGEPWTLPVTVAAGVAVDLDHGPDLWWNLALGHSPVAVFVLHAWEWLAGLLALGIETGFSWWLTAVVVGYGLHIITDHINNKGRMWRYSIAYRARHGFKVARLAPQWDSNYTYSVLKREIPPAVVLIEWWRRRARRDKEHKVS